MSNNIVLNPDIENLEPDSLKEKMYTRMYTSFFTAQIQKSPSNPNGIVEGDLTSIALKNSAFSFADIISDSIDIGAAGVEIDVSNLVKKSGDSMIGRLTANMGLSAGENGVKIISTFSDKDGNSGIDLDGILRLSGSLLLNGKDVISRVSDTTTISDDSVSIVAKKITIDSKDINIAGFILSDGNITFNDDDFYSSRNSNNIDSDWIARNMTVDSRLDVNNGLVVNGGMFLALGEDFDIGGGAIASDVDGTINFNSPVSFNDNIFLNKKEIIEVNGSNVAIGYEDGTLILGTEKTKEVRINKGLRNWNGTDEIVSRTGYGKFNGFEAGHDFSESLIKTDKDGVIFTKNILIGDNKFVSLSSADKKLSINTNGGRLSIAYLDSDSAYKPQNRPSKTHYIESEGDFVSFNTPVEASEVNIKKSETKIEAGKVKISKNRYIEDSAGGMVVHGDTRFLDTISTQKYASGYGGNGWAIAQDALSGMTSMSIDEITVRRKMRIYELEIQKIKATNGALWVSDSMAADTVEKIL